ncbi:magnesium transporter [Photobacterium sp. DA100]|uniref:magnesium transporter n=1 Tax=Photobacterium sp. DA100 TaxID=3027472 RepID=UPI00247A86A5|nr:magnesium transporter [Photobacterium sp. DA100]WEM40926.1 magnesium transporter [Photobacterium sp. DA100]
MKKLIGFVKWLVKAMFVLSCLVGCSLFFSTLSKIHGKAMPASDFVGGNPTIIKLLNSEVFMGVIFVVTISIFSYVGYLFWRLHEVAVHESEHQKSAHTTLVFALSLCGLMINKVWWVLALIIAFTRWDVIGDALSGVIRKGVSGSRLSSEDSKQ